MAGHSTRECPIAKLSILSPYFDLRADRPHWPHRAFCGKKTGLEIGGKKCTARNIFWARLKIELWPCLFIYSKIYMWTCWQQVSVGAKTSLQYTPPVLLKEQNCWVKLLRGSKTVSPKGRGEASVAVPWAEVVAPGVKQPWKYLLIQNIRWDKSTMMGSTTSSGLQLEGSAPPSCTGLVWPPCRHLGRSCRVRKKAQCCNVEGVDLATGVRTLSARLLACG